MSMQSVGTYPTQEAAQVPELRQINDNLAVLVSQLQKTALRIQGALDRLHGGKPQAIGGEAKQPEASPVALSTLRAIVERLSSTDAHFCELANRLDTIA